VRRGSRFSQGGRTIYKSAGNDWIPVSLAGVGALCRDEMFWLLPGCAMPLTDDVKL